MVDVSSKGRVRISFFYPHTVLSQGLGNSDLDLSAESEDCLKLNIYTPADSATSERPVLVWIHGGFLKNGFSGRPTFDGTVFATEHGIVVVTLDYRLNGRDSIRSRISVNLISPRQPSDSLTRLNCL